MLAVVAEEVRNLAQRFSNAARETAEKIEDSIQKSEKGVLLNANVGVSLQALADRTRKVDELVVQIASASSEQNLGGRANQFSGFADESTESFCADPQRNWPPLLLPT